MKKHFTIKSIVITSALSVLVTLGAVALALWMIIGAPELAVIGGMKYIEKQFVGEYDKDTLADAALDAMVDSLGDRWSYYADAHEYAAMKDRRNNSFVGVGVTVTYEQDGLHIQSLMEDGPAQQAGLLPGEIIVAVDGTVLMGDDVREKSKLISGEEGTEVVLSVRDVHGNTREVTVVRAKLKEVSVNFEMIDGDVGYVSVKNFYDGTAENAKQAVEELMAQGARAIVFDMRDNPGGYLNELIDLLDYLLPEGVIFQSGTQEGPQEETRSDSSCVDLPMAVLVNENSYSAAEFFAAQLRESVNAVIVGETTFGKGHSQQVFELPGGRAINLSTKTYYTGSGMSLIGVGVVPDKVVSLTGEEDAQLQALLDLLQ